MKNWLKGGLVALFVAFVLMIILIPFGSTPCRKCDLPIPLPIWAFVPFLTVIISEAKIHIIANNIFLAIGSSFFIYFIVGAIIGFVIEKIKSKKF